MIDFYNNLPDVMIFMHSERYQWHNDDPVYGKWPTARLIVEDWITNISADSVPLLQNLQLPYVVSEGYANLRCVWTIGCPSELKLDQQNHTDKTTQIAYPEAFQELFPGEPIPSVVGVACCAQFALTREKIHERSLEDYRRYRQWLLDTSLDDNVSGRILEYTWHVIFWQVTRSLPKRKGMLLQHFWSV